MTGPYEDMLTLPHHRSPKHPPMSMSDRAGQFSPFAALNGHSSAIQETERLTDRRIQLDGERIAQLDRMLTEALELGQTVTITYFVPDRRKSGGAYVDSTGTIKRIDPIEGIVLLMDSTRIPLEDILNVLTL